MDQSFALADGVDHLYFSLPQLHTYFPVSIQAGQGQEDCSWTVSYLAFSCPHEDDKTSHLRFEHLYLVLINLANAPWGRNTHLLWRSGESTVVIPRPGWRHSRNQSRFSISYKAATGKGNYWVCWAALVESSVLWPCIWRAYIKCCFHGRFERINSPQYGIIL